MINWQTNAPLSDHTTFRVGGPADHLTVVKTSAELIEAVRQARKNNWPYLVLGNGSNTLFADKGFRGAVIINDSQEIKVSEGKGKEPEGMKLKPRFDALEKETQDLTGGGYDFNDYPPVWVKLDSGVTLPRAIFGLIAQGVTGLEWFAGIPATAGGASFINLHGGNKYWSDFLVEAEILNDKGELITVLGSYFNYDYDDSKIKKTKDTVVTVTLKLYRGPKDQALAIAKTWSLKKSHQPQRSAGCIFQNLDAATQAKLKLPTSSIGYLMDKELGLKGKMVGNARIGEKHAGFIENLGSAKADDIFQLIKLMKQTAKTKFGLDLKLEIVPLGFTAKEAKWLD